MQLVISDSFIAITISINQVSPFGLIINELISNALKQAFPDDRKGAITVSYKNRKRKLRNSLWITVLEGLMGWIGKFNIKEIDMKILIIEDSVTQAKLIKKIITKIDDIEPILAKDALEGFAILRAIPEIELVILDYLMPYINGIDFLKKLRSTASFKKLPVLVSSSENTPIDFIKAGANKCMIKPYSAKKLNDYITSIKAK